MSQFLRDFFPRIGIPDAHIPGLLTYADQMMAEADFAPLLNRFMKQDFSDIQEILSAVGAIGARFGAHPYTSHLLFHAAAAEPLLANYRAAGMDEEIYWDSMRDLTWKYQECQDVHHIPGSFVSAWFGRFFFMTRFALGRLQYEHYTFQRESYTAAGVTLSKGDDIINIHIPAAGPLTKESRMDSYRRAYAFFKGDFKDGIVPFVCSSWLLYPAHREFLPAHSNILSFMDDFDIIDSSTSETFSNDWRVFADSSKKPMAEWYEDTSMRRAYKKWLMDGGKAGSGYGVILFDGERAINK